MKNLKKVSAQIATHRSFPDTIIQYKKIETPFGQEIEVRFANGETTSMSPKRFDELFQTNK